VSYILRQMPGMKKVFDFGRLIVSQPKGSGCVALVGAVLLLVVGCTKSNNAQAAAPSSGATNSSATSSGSPTPVVYAPAAGVTNADNTQLELQTLNKALLGWMIKNHRHPQNFAEFASSTDIQIPEPPPGKKYALNPRGFIIFADNSTQ
jgi:hypothetical protein